MLSQPVPSLEARVKATFTLELYDTFLSCRSCSLIKSDIISDLCRPSQTPRMQPVIALARFLHKVETLLQTDATPTITQGTPY